MAGIDKWIGVDRFTINDASFAVDVDDELRAREFCPAENVANLAATVAPVKLVDVT